MALPKWTDERTEALTNFVGAEVPISQETVAEAAAHLETSTRSISSKLRKMGYDVVLASANSSKAFSEAQEATLAAFVQDNSGEYTYAEIADHFEDGAFDRKSVQGKILSMELTGHIKAAVKPEAVRTYTSEEEVVFIQMVKDGAFVEDIAAKFGKPVNSIRGKALSLLRSGEIDAIPRQESVKGAKEDPFADLTDIASMTVEDIADAIGKTVRGVKTMLTRRGLSASDYSAKSTDGASV